MSISAVLLPIFGLILLGWGLKRVGLFRPRMVHLVNDYVYYIGMTAVVFLSLHDIDMGLLLDPDIYLLNILPMLGIVAIAFAVGKLMHLRKELFAVFIVCALYGNTVYIGLTLNSMVQGPSSLGLTAFIATLSTVVVFTLGIHILQENADGPVDAGKLYKLPVIWAAGLGLALSWYTLPDVVRLPLDLISVSTSPLALLATGAMIETSALTVDLKEIGALSALKLTVAPALVLAVGMATGSQGMTLNTSLLEAATPVGVTNTVMAEQFKMDSAFAARAVVISTALFAVTLAIMLQFI